MQRELFQDGYWRVPLLFGMTKVGRRLLHCKLHRYDGESTRRSRVMARALQSHRNSVRPSVVKILVLWMLEKYTHARSLYEAVGYRLESERQKQIITLKAPLGDGEYVRTAHVAQRGSRPGEGTSS
jgi:hypothetical protein